MREAFQPSLPLNSSGIENNNNNHKEYSHISSSNSNCCHKEKDLNIDRNNEIAKEIPINETDKICFDSDEGKLRESCVNYKTIIVPLKFFHTEILLII